jgi:hypothetical protein
VSRNEEKNDCSREVEPFLSGLARHSFIFSAIGTSLSGACAESGKASPQDTPRTGETTEEPKKKKSK